MIPAARVGTLTWRARDPFLWRALARNLLPAKDGYGDGLRHALTAGRHVISFGQARDGRAFTSAGWTRANPDLIGRRVQGCSNIRGPKSISNGRLHRGYVPRQGERHNADWKNRFDLKRLFGSVTKQRAPKLEQAMIVT
jgi:hypothetical protein